MKALFIICLIAVCAGAGCEKTVWQPDLSPVSAHYIRSYNAAIRMVDEKPRHSWETTEPTMYAAAVWRASFGTEENYITEENDPVRFDSLATAHGDTHWNQQGAEYNCLFRVTTGLHAVCDKDFDAAHPAGASMDDLMTVGYSCFDDLLVNGEYINKPRSEEQIAQNLSAYEYRAPLDKFNTLRMKLLMANFSLSLTKAPEKTDVYRFTFTYTNEDGKKLVAKGRPLMIQGEK